MYLESIREPDFFWSRLAKQLYWKKHWDTSGPVCTYNFDVRKGPIHVEVSLFSLLVIILNEKKLQNIP